MSCHTCVEINLTDSEIERLWSPIEASDDGCWIWNGSVNKEGAAVIHLTRRISPRTRAIVRPARRLIWEQVEGRPLPKGTCMRPICNNQLCVNPEHMHLFQRNNFDGPYSLFWQNVKKGKDCWIWIGQLDDWGYGHYSHGVGDIKETRAHRISWIVANGRSIPDGLIICHKCDNPPCLNPDHLFLGTNRDNYEDARSKGRLRHHKLTERDVVEIRQRRAAGELCKSIAHDYRVTYKHIWAVCHAGLWSRVS